ncbi:MAG TPA: hypothetical protein VN754_09120 [Candidatus Binataceae bacterium]|nr:hypothetical protein [Candidatus Binataceae bacterium]
MPDERDKTIAATPLVIDLSAIEDLADGDPAVEAELIAMFVRHTVEAIASGRCAIDSGQPQDIARIAHTCIGFTSTLGLTTLIPTLRALERATFAPALENPAAEELTQLIERWEREFQRVAQALHALTDRSAAG